jgi:hypothetical protein
MCIVIRGSDSAIHLRYTCATMLGLSLHNEVLGLVTRLLIERCAVCDDLRLAQPRGQVNLKFTPPEGRALHNEALVQRISLCRSQRTVTLS